MMVLAVESDPIRRPLSIPFLADIGVALARGALVLALRHPMLGVGLILIKVL